MITIQETIEPFDTFCNFLGYNPETCLFFDIETTGFSPASSAVFLIGVICRIQEQWQLVQYLAQNQEEEKELVRDFLALALHYKSLIHFNGSTFDIPYLAQKAADYGLENPLSAMESIDLYQKFRPLKKLLSLERMNQISLEAFLQYHREDRLTGKHMVSLFQKYASSKEPGIRDLLLLHNHDDLMGMTQILRMCAYLMMPDEVTEPILTGRQESSDKKYSENHPECSDPVSGNAAWCSECLAPAPESLHSHFTDSDSVCKLHFTLKTALPLPLDCVIDDAYRLHIRGAGGSITIPAFCGELRYFFSDYKNYYYLPLEDQAIHKSVGAYVDKTHRTAAKPQNCYVRKNGVFLPQPEPVFEPAFRKSFDDKQLYFEYTDTVEPQPETLLIYVKQLLKKLLP